MKKVFLLSITVLLFASALFGASTVAISPSVVGAGTTGMTFSINYTSSNSLTWINSGASTGFLTVQIPSGWTSPTVGNTAPGNVQAFVITSSFSITVPANNISISGNTITVSASGLSINHSDTLEIVYGSGGGNMGVTVPIATGPYTFYMAEAPGGTTTATALASSPFVTVVLLGMSKTASESSIEALDTYTYTIIYGNNTAISANGASIWDTIPPELTYLSASGNPSVTSTGSGTLLNWYLGLIGNNSSGSITITTVASSEIMSVASSITNIAMATSSDMSAGIALQSNPCIAIVKGVTLTARIDGYPNPALPGQVITMNLLVNNTGSQINATNVLPGTMGDANSSLVTINSGPTPTYISSLMPGNGNTAIFTWVFTTNSVGTVVFTDSASASEIDTNGTLIRTSNTYAFTFVIANPTPTPTSTRTPSPTFTITSSPTLVITGTCTITETNTPTLTLSSTLTSTYTEIPSATDSVTSTETIVFTATNTLTNQGIGNTATATPVITAVHTVSPVVTNTPAPNLNMTLSKNYVNPDKGEKLRINVKTAANVNVKIQVYNLTGEIIRKDIGFTAPSEGWNQAEWDIKNGEGKIVGEGLYFVYIESGTDKKLLKVYIIK